MASFKSYFKFRDKEEWEVRDSNVRIQLIRLLTLFVVSPVQDAAPGGGAGGGDRGPRGGA